MTDLGMLRLSSTIEFLRTPPARAVILVTFVVIVTITAFYVLRRWRDHVKDEDTTSDHLTKFRELERRGVLSDGEFRTIKTALSEKLKDELNNDAEKG